MVALIKDDIVDRNSIKSFGEMWMVKYIFRALEDIIWSHTKIKNYVLYIYISI